MKIKYAQFNPADYVEDSVERALGTVRQELEQQPQYQGRRLLTAHFTYKRGFLELPQPQGCFDGVFNNPGRRYESQCSIVEEQDTLKSGLFGRKTRKLLKPVADVTLKRVHKDGPPIELIFGTDDDDKTATGHMIVAHVYDKSVKDIVERHLHDLSQRHGYLDIIT